MKITKSQLKQLIKEELEQALEETPVELPEEQEQLDEGVINTIIKALQSPQVKEALKSIVLPIIQDNFPELAPKPVEPTPPRDAENPKPVIKKVRQ